VEQVNQGGTFARRETVAVVFSRSLGERRRVVDGGVVFGGDVFVVAVFGDVGGSRRRFKVDLWLMS
jgi:hypothetical protein